MFERYTERARRVLFFARYEASQLGSTAIESEHLLLGLLREGGGVAHQILADAHLRHEDALATVGDSLASAPRIATAVEIQLGGRCKQALQNAAEEADRHQCPHIGTEHMLLGLLHETDSVVARILAGSGVTLSGARVSIAAGVRPVPPREFHVVLVQVVVRPELQDAFQQALLHNARESVRCDPGCVRFDVSQDKDDSTRWILYEVYDSPEAHATHRQSSHFLAYDAVAAKAVVEKTVVKCASRHVT
jgi:quinol monooxygenase YgiN